MGLETIKATLLTCLLPTCWGPPKDLREGWWVTAPLELAAESQYQIGSNQVSSTCVDIYVAVKCDPIMVLCTKSWLCKGLLCPGFISPICSS